MHVFDRRDVLRGPAYCAWASGHDDHRRRGLTYITRHTEGFRGYDSLHGQMERLSREGLAAVFERPLWNGRW